jgi:hypothetical protein
VATGYLKGAFESVPGNEANTPTLSTKVLYVPGLSFEWGLNPDPLMRDDEIRNLDEPIAAISEGYGPTWSLDTRLYPDAAGFLLKHMLGNPVTTPGNGVITDPDTVAIPAGAHRHVWTAPFGPAGVNPLTVEWIAAYKDQSTFFRLKGCGVSQLSIELPERGGVRLRASGPCLYVARITDPSLVPAYESLAVRPWVGGNFTIPTWLTGSANCERSGFTIALSNEMEPYSSCQNPSKFPDQLEKGDPPIVFSGAAPKRLVDIDDYDALLNATGFATKTRFVNDAIIASAYPYKLFFETTNSQYMEGGPNPLVNSRRIGASFGWKSTNASGTPGSTVVTLVNATPSYA